MAAGRRLRDTPPNATVNPLLDSSAIISISLDLLKNYIEENILPKQKRYLNALGYKELDLRIILSLALLVVGASYGVPWMNSSSEAAEIFPETTQAFLKQFFPLGIVITVGGDGLWFMSMLIEKFIRPQSESEKKLFQKDEVTLLKILRLAATIILPVFGAIAPVYASYTYSIGWKKGLSSVVALDVYAGGLVAYDILLRKTIDYVRARNNPEFSSSLQARKEVIQSVTAVIDQRSATLAERREFSDAEEFLNFIKQQHDLLPETTNQKTAQIKQIVQIALSLIIAVTSTAVTFLLSKEAFKKYLHIDNAAANIMAVFSEAPSFVLALVSSYEVFEKLL
ncbi:MAG: hypothetical protein ACD_45C00713G0001, partial [uncultured bacterium]